MKIFLAMFCLLLGAALGFFLGRVSLQDELADWRNRAGSQGQAEETLQARVEKKSALLREVERQRDEARSRVAHGEEQIKIWEARIQEMKAALSGREARAETLEKEKQALKESLSGLTSDKAHLQESLQRAEDRLFQLEEAWTRFNQEVAAAEERKEKASQEEIPPPPTLEEKQTALMRDFILRFNQALQADAVKDLLLIDALGVAGGKILAGYFHRVGASGVVDGALYAGEMEVVLPPVKGVVWLVFRDGYRIRDGQRQPFPEGKTRVEIAPTDLDRWKGLVPELFAGDTSRETTSHSRLIAGDSLTERLNSLLASSGGADYRFRSIASVRGEELLGVEIVRLDARGQVDLTIHAARGRPLFHAKDRAVEIVLREGKLQVGQKRSALPAFGYRLLFPDLDPADWKRAGGPGS